MAKKKRKTLSRKDLQDRINYLECETERLIERIQEQDATGRENRVLKKEVAKLQGAVTGQQLHTAANADKWRSRVESLERELAVIREGKVMACPCPVGQCRKLKAHILGDTCWYQWAHSRRGITDMITRAVNDATNPLESAT